MTISEMLNLINKEIGRPLIKDGRKKILANPYKFICEGNEYIIYRNVERVGMTEILRTQNEDEACNRFLKELRSL